MCCGKKCLKYTNLIYITFFTLICVGQILLGVYLMFMLYNLIRPEILGELNIFVPSLLLCIFGIILIPMIFLGYCGFCKEVSCCVNLYSSLFIILAVAQIFMGTYAVMTFTENNKELISEIKTDLTFSLINYKNYPDDLPRIQNRLHCCGVHSYEDWPNSTLHWSCCAAYEIKCDVNSRSLHIKGCLETTLDLIVIGNLIIGYASLAVGILEVLVAVMGFILGCGHFKNSYSI